MEYSGKNESPGHFFTIEHRGKTIEIKDETTIEILDNAGETKTVIIQGVDVFEGTIAYGYPNDTESLEIVSKDDFVLNAKSAMDKEFLNSQEKEVIQVSTKLPSGHVFKADQTYEIPMADGSTSQFTVKSVKVLPDGKKFVHVKRDYPGGTPNPSMEAFVQEINRYVSDKETAATSESHATNGANAPESPSIPLKPVDSVAAASSEVNMPASSGIKGKGGSNDTLAKQLAQVKVETDFPERVELESINIVIEGEELVLRKGVELGVFRKGKSEVITVPHIFENPSNDDISFEIESSEWPGWSPTVTELTDAIVAQDQIYNQTMLAEKKLVDSNGSFRKDDKCLLGEGDSAKQVFIVGFVKHPDSGEYHTRYRDASGKESVMSSEYFEDEARKLTDEDGSNQKKMVSRRKFLVLRNTLWWSLLQKMKLSKKSFLLAKHFRSQQALVRLSMFMFTTHVRALIVKMLSTL